MNIEDIRERLKVILAQLRCPYISEDNATYSTEVNYRDKVIYEKLKEKNIEI